MTNIRYGSGPLLCLSGTVSVPDKLWVRMGNEGLSHLGRGGWVGGGGLRGEVGAGG